MVETRDPTRAEDPAVKSRPHISASILSLLSCTQITQFQLLISVSFNVSERGKCQSVQDDAPGKVSINIKAFTHWMCFCASCASIPHKFFGSGSNFPTLSTNASTNHDGCAQWMPCLPPIITTTTATADKLTIRLSAPNTV